MSFVYTPEKQRAATGAVNYAEAGDDLRLMLVMTNTTADTEEDSSVIADITTLDEYDGSGYSRAALASQVVTQDSPNNRSEVSATSPVSFGATVGAGTRQAQAAILYRFVDGTAANDQLVAFIDTGGFPLNGGGGPFEFAINAEGILQIT